MDLLEYQGKQLFGRYGIPVSPGAACTTVDDAVVAAARVGYPVVIKEQQLHPVRGNLIHLDFHEVRLDTAIEAEVVIELEGSNDAPGVKEGCVLEHVTREVTVEALPTEIPAPKEAWVVP